MSNLLLPPAKPDRVADFCHGVFAKHSEEWPISEKVLADEFLAFTGLKLVANPEEVSAICAHKFGIVVSHRPLPDGLRGFNGSFGDRREILISTNQDYYRAKLHTLLHELREILESEFRELGHPIAASNDDLEQHAEDFATVIQISSAFNAVPVLFENAGEIEREWMRFGAYVLIILGALAYTLSCLSTTEIEANLAASSRLAR